MNIVFIHGWGYDRTIWHRMADGFEGHDISYVELGFTGKPPVTDIPSNAVVIGHSLGVMWALRNAPSTIRGLVSLAGFDCFKAHIPARDIRAMQRNLKTDPEKQMKGFYAASGYVPFHNINAMNVSRLEEGLQWLAEWDESPVLRYLPCKVMGLAAEDDLIVPIDMSRAIWEKHDLRVAKTGGHSLPMTQTEWCLKQIGGYLNAL